MATNGMQERVGSGVEVIKRKTLLERLGGETFVFLMLNSFFDEMIRTPDLKRFFRDAPVETIKTHQAKLFRCLLGPAECIPNTDDIADYMIMTHTRLFREAGLNETHFDMVAECLVKSFQSFLIVQSLIDECIALLVPLRVVFEYGAKIAENEKKMDEKTRSNLPVCSAKTVGTDLDVVLPVSPNGSVPSWLPTELKKISKTKTLRDWTAHLSDRCSVVGDLFVGGLHDGLALLATGTCDECIGYDCIDR